MHLAQIRADNFRSLEQLSLTLHRKLNLILGPNAAGKTSLLEMVYCLARAKSFRGGSAAELAGPAGRRWLISGIFEIEEDLQRKCAISWGPQGTEISLELEPSATTLDLVRCFPAQVMEPGAHRLLQEGPAYRRSFLDWGVFHVEPRFLGSWRRFQRALRQRNHLLRRVAPANQVKAWHKELAEAGEDIHALREAHIANLRSILDKLLNRLLDISDWEMLLRRGWSSERSFAEVLETELERDRRQGTTVEGPHRAELNFKLQARQAKTHISRGQQKLLICALILAQAQLIQKQTGVAPILLLDDFSAELASGFQEALSRELQAYDGQIFITAFDTLPEVFRSQDKAVFHVEHGRIAPG